GTQVFHWISAFAEMTGSYGWGERLRRDNVNPESDTKHFSGKENLPSPYPLPEGEGFLPPFSSAKRDVLLPAPTWKGMFYFLLPLGEGTRMREAHFLRPRVLAHRAQFQLHKASRL